MVSEVSERRVTTQRADVAEKYLNMRTQSFTRTHAKRMQQFLDSTGFSEEDYWERWQDDLQKSVARWEKDVKQIDSDPNLNFMQKREAKNRLNRLYPSWTEEQEERFIRAYGDPREVARGRLEQLLDEMDGPTWRNAFREGQITEVTKAPWELKFRDAITDPRDGSVALHLDAALIGKTRGSDLPPVGDITFDGEESVDPKLLRARRDVARRVCPYCLKYFQRVPDARHLTKCATDNGQVYVAP